MRGVAWFVLGVLVGVVGCVLSVLMPLSLSDPTEGVL